MSDEDEPAPSPSAAVVARRASRIAKSLREESGCEEDTSSDDEWDPAQEQDEEDEEDEQDERNQGLADASTYGRSRLHEMPRAREDGTGEEMRNDHGPFMYSGSPPFGTDLCPIAALIAYSITATARGTSGSAFIGTPSIVSTSAIAGSKRHS